MGSQFMGWGEGSSTVSSTAVMHRPERNPVTAPADDRRRVEKGYFRFMEVGVQFGVTIVLLTLLGIWLDHHFHKSPLFTIIFMLFAFVAATYNLIRAVLAPDRAADKPDPKP